MKVNREATLSFLNTTSAATLRRFLDSVPDHASVRVTVSPGDRPFDVDLSLITAEWADELDPEEDQ